MKLLTIKERFTDLRKSDEELLYFITFLYALASGEVGSVDLIKTGQESKYGRYSKAFQEIYRLGVGWGYGLSKSCEMVAAKISSNNDTLKQLLVKFSQVIRLGDEMNMFFKSELTSTMHTYSVLYERNLESQKLFLEMFYTISSTASFMIASNSIMAMLMGNNNSEFIFLSSFVGVATSMGSFVFILFMIFPRDRVVISSHSNARKFHMSLYAAILTGVSIGVFLTLTNLLPLTLVVAISTVPLFIPGLIARKLESDVKNLDDWYPSFVRHFGEIYTMVGSMGQTLDAVLRSNFGPLQNQIISFKNRIKNRIEVETAFETFSKESGSTIIESGNKIVSKAMVKGANMNEVGIKVSEVSAKISELRAKRRQTSKTFETIVIVLHGLTMAIFGLMTTLIEIFHTMLSTVQVSNQAFTLSPIDPAFIRVMIPLAVLVISTINGVAIKVGQGGLFKTVWYNIALLNVSGGIAAYGTTQALSQFLSNHILDIGETPH